MNRYGRFPKRRRNPHQGFVSPSFSLSSVNKLYICLLYTSVKDLSKATIALVTSGGIVPKGNPDHIESSNASHYGEYDITGVMDLTEETYETAHGGYDPVYANEDADRVLPVDVLRDMEKEAVSYTHLDVYKRQLFLSLS